VVAFFVGEAEQPLLENRIAPVPQRQRQAQELPVVAEAGETVLAPAISAAARLIVGEIIPRGAEGAVVLAHGAPLPLAQIGPPAPQIGGAIAVLFDASPFGVNGLRHGLSSPPCLRPALARLPQAPPLRLRSAGARRRACRRRTKPAPGRRADGGEGRRRKSRRWCPSPDPPWRHACTPASFSPRSRCR